MFVTQIISTTIFVISLLLSFLCILTSLFKNVGATYFGISSWIIYVIIPFFPFVLEQGILRTAPDVWGIAYIFIVFHLLLLLLPYYLLVGTLIFGKKHIYRVNHFLILKKYSYNDVIRYRMKYESGITLTRFGHKKVITYMFEIYFFDKHYSEFHVNKHNDRKITYIKKILEDNRCKKNKRIDESTYKL